MTVMVGLRGMLGMPGKREDPGMTLTAGMRGMIGMPVIPEMTWRYLECLE